MPTASQRGLDALVHGGVPAAGAEPPCRPAGRAVLDERPDHQDERHQRRADAERSERRRTEMADDRGVDEQVQRLGGQHDERRRGQSEQPPGRHWRDAVTDHELTAAVHDQQIDQALARVPEAARDRRR